MEFRKTNTQRTNVQQILGAIVERGPISRRELQKLTGFSCGLISEVTGRLMGAGYLMAEEVHPAARVGRPVEKLDIATGEHYCIGVDIDWDGMYAVVTDMKGRLVESGRHAWPERTRESVLQTLYSVLDALLEQYRDQSVAGLGVSVQGITDRKRGVSVCIKRIRDWVEVPLRSLLRQRYRLPVEVVHNPDCLMESARAFGLLKRTDAKDVLLMHYNHRAQSIGMSVLVNGQIYVGHRERAAEIGYTVVGDKADGSPRLLVEDMADGGVNSERFYESAGKAMAVANSLFNPEIILLHIPDHPDGDRLAATVEHWIRKTSYDTTVTVKRSPLEPEAQARGAAMIMIRQAIDALTL